MPVIIAENDQPKWLGEEPASEQESLTLLKPGFDNLKTAKALSLTMPLSLLGRADLAIVRFWG